jgi:hypothetical protein
MEIADINILTITKRTSPQSEPNRGPVTDAKCPEWVLSNGPYPLTKDKLTSIDSADTPLTRTVDSVVVSIKLVRRCR